MQICLLFILTAHIKNSSNHLKGVLLIFLCDSLCYTLDPFAIYCSPSCILVVSQAQIPILHEMQILKTITRFSLLHFSVRSVTLIALVSISFIIWLHTYTARKLEGTRVHFLGFIKTFIKAWKN